MKNLEIQYYFCYIWLESLCFNAVFGNSMYVSRVTPFIVTENVTEVRPNKLLVLLGRTSVTFCVTINGVTRDTYMLLPKTALKHKDSRQI